MTLGQLFSGITDIPQKLTERVVSGVTSDNREVEPGFLFVCVSLLKNKRYINATDVHLPSMRV